MEARGSERGYAILNSSVYLGSSHPTPAPPRPIRPRRIASPRSTPSPPHLYLTAARLPFATLPTLTPPGHRPTPIAQTHRTPQTPRGTQRTPAMDRKVPLIPLRAGFHGSPQTDPPQALWTTQGHPPHAPHGRTPRKHPTHTVELQHIETRCNRHEAHKTLCSRHGFWHSDAAIVIFLTIAIWPCPKSLN